MVKKGVPGPRFRDFIPAYAGEDAVAFFRAGKTGCVFIAVNRGGDSTLKIDVPAGILAMQPDLKCVYGGNGYFRPRAKQIDFYIGAKNGYIFAV